MKFVHMVAAISAFSIPAAAFAQDPTPPTPAPAKVASATAKPAGDPNRVICKSEDETGSLIAKKKICLTAQQWRDRAFNGGQWTEHMSTYNSQPNGR